MYYWIFCSVYIELKYSKAHKKRFIHLLNCKAVPVTVGLTAFTETDNSKILRFLQASKHICLFFCYGFDKNQLHVWLKKGVSEANIVSDRSLLST